jgi:hypothetical protein
MRHPFDGLMAEASREANEPKRSRRSALGRLLAAFAGLLGATQVACNTTSAFQQASPGGGGGGISTMALGEEGGGGPKSGGGSATTYAMGEEGGAKK